MAVLWLWTFTTLLFILQTDIAVNGFPTQNLHEHMTKREIEYFFGVVDHDEVPEYEITSPYQSNNKGDFVSYSLRDPSARSKRDAERYSKHSYFTLNVFGEKLHVKVKRNEHLLAPDLRLVRRTGNGRTTSHPAPRNTFYVGHVVSDPRSTVALSNDRGLTGLVKTSRDTLFVHPIPTHLSKQMMSRQDATPHLVYRRSLKDSGALCKTTEDEAVVRSKRSLDPKNSPPVIVSDSVPPVTANDSPTPLFKTLKVALMYPAPLKEKYSFYGSLGGVENYLLVVANMVAGMFQDPSFGKIKITYVITNVTEIDPAQYGFNLTDSASSKLRNLEHKVKQDSTVSKVPYDVFTYVSNAISEDIGLATFNQICKGTTGNLNHDKGLQTALHIAHETGHNLGLDHGQGSCAGYIMSSIVPGGEHASEWSKCSRNVIQPFLADRRSHCLDDEPTGDGPPLPPQFRNILPGQILDSNKQCETHYGKGWRRHDTHQCAHLRCINGNTMQSKNIVVADGTKCGPTQWCIKGKCSDHGFGFPIFPHGAAKWSEWEPYSDCSGVCGDGFQQVQHRTRQCIRPVAETSCKGASKEYRTCKMKSCPQTVTETEFRSNACSKRTDGYSISYFRGSHPCDIYCRRSWSAKRVGHMPDGTNCRRSSAYPAICVQGSCRIVGCDDVVESKKLVDRCGVCGGVANTCKKVFKEYTDNPALSGPDNAALIVTLPTGTRFAMFEMKNDTYNYLGVQDALGSYLVGGHLGGDQVKEAAGSTIHYFHTTPKDSIQILKPINAPLRVMYIRKSDQYTNPGVTYTFIAPGIPGVPADFEWINDNWSGCSRACASGIRKRTRRCVVKDDRSPVNSSACGGPPEETEPCNTQPCEAKWVMKWTPCSKTCGKGEQVHKTKCLQQVTETTFRETNTCNTDPKPNPPSVLLRFCNEYPCPPQWIVGNWSKCPLRCGLATRERSVSCSRVDEAGKLTVIADEFCRYLNKPVAKVKCNEDKHCGQYEIGCFNTPQGLFSYTLGDFTQESDPNKALMECKELTKQSGYSVFSLGHGGLCMSGPDAQKIYYRHKPAFNRNKCSNGIGIGDHSVVYTFDPPPQFEAVGCYKDSRKRALPTLYANFRPLIDWSNMNATIRQCAFVARDIGYKYFAVQFYGECWSSWVAADNYGKYGKQTSSKCWANVGGPMTNYVYRFPQE